MKKGEYCYLAMLAEDSSRVERSSHRHEEGVVDNGGASLLVRVVERGTDEPLTQMFSLQIIWEDLSATL